MSTQPVSGAGQRPAAPPSPAASPPAQAQDRAEARRLSAFSLFFLAMGGVLGSGWMLSMVPSGNRIGLGLPLGWLLGGVLMLLVVTVMVELSTTAPKTGGLIFLPLQSSGPLLATVVAAGLWVFYAVNPASEAAAMIRGLVQWLDWHGLTRPGTSADSLTWTGRGLAVLFVALIAAVNLLGPRWFLRINAVLTLFKLLVPLLVIALTVYAWTHHSSVRLGQPASAGSTGDPVLFPLLTSITGGSIVYAYLGFQGPLDFAGNVRRQGIGEAARLRRAVYATVWGSILLYVSLEAVTVYLRLHTGQGPNSSNTSASLYTAFAQHAVPGWFGQLVGTLINLDSVLSPAGSALVFTYVLTREVAALSRAHLTHRGLQTSRYSVIPVAARPGLRRLFGERLDVYWLILFWDCCLSAALLLFFHGNWNALSSLTSVLALVVYGTPGVVLAALYRRQGRVDRHARLYQLLAGTVFAAVAFAYFLGGWHQLWPSLAGLSAGCLVLFAVPAVFPGSRWYDAKSFASQLMHPRRNPSAQSALVFYGFFAVATLASLPVTYLWPGPDHNRARLCCAVPIGVLGYAVFRRLVSLSVQYMEAHEPTLPEPLERRRSGLGVGLEPGPETVGGSGPAAAPAAAPPVTAPSE